MVERQQRLSGGLWVIVSDLDLDLLLLHGPHDDEELGFVNCVSDRPLGF